MTPQKRGNFISLDGPDGGGKTTQVQHLARWLALHRMEVVTCRDPGGTPLGERLRPLLLERHGTAISMRAEMLLYMASRAQLVEETIRPALMAGKMVVSDRFLLANVVYQGFAGGLPMEEVWEVGKVATGGLMPDLTILLDVPSHVARERVGNRGKQDRIEGRDESYHDAVRRGFLRAAENYPGRIVLIDGSFAADVVATQIEREVASVLGESAWTR